MCNEFLSEKAEDEKIKIEQLSKEIGKSSTNEAISKMKAMNISDELVQQIKDKFESDVRENVRQIQGTAYETYD